MCADLIRKEEPKNKKKYPLPSQINTTEHSDPNQVKVRIKLM